MFWNGGGMEEWLRNSNMLPFYVTGFHVMKIHYGIKLHNNDYRVVHL